MVIEFKCDSVAGGFPGQIVMALLTSDKDPGSQPQTMLVNVLQSNLIFEQGDTVEVTFRVTKHHGDSAETHHEH